MKDYQKETIDTYEKNLDLYLSRTPKENAGCFKEFLDNYIEQLPVDPLILELGSGTGRDANYIEKNSKVKIMRTDIASSFINYQEEAFGISVKYLDALDLDESEKYDSMLAIAVLLHFEKEDCKSVCTNIYRALKQNGSLAFRIKAKLTESVSEITSQKMESPRYFYYWEASEFLDMLEKIGFTCDNITQVDNGKWIQGVAYKK